MPFFFNAAATTDIYTLSLHDALPILLTDVCPYTLGLATSRSDEQGRRSFGHFSPLIRSEEHTSELQSRRDLVCRLLLEKKNELTPTATCAAFYRRLQHVPLAVVEWVT